MPHCQYPQVLARQSLRAAHRAPRVISAPGMPDPKPAADIRSPTARRLRLLLILGWHCMRRSSTCHERLQ